MNRFIVATIALSALAGSFQASAVAGPQVPGPRGRMCSHSAVVDPSPEAGHDAVSGEVNAGPVLGEPGGELFCTVQVGQSSHWGIDTVVRSSGPSDSTGVAVVFALDVAYVWPQGSRVYVCTSYREADGTMIYWHATDRASGYWTFDYSKPCEEVLVDRDAGCGLAALMPVGEHAFRSLRGCAGAAPTGHITIHRFPASVMHPVGGVRLYAAPVAANGMSWGCTDVHTNAPVATGSLLRSPDPGVTCTPPSGYTNECFRVDSGGYHADSGLGMVGVESACAGLSVVTPIQIPSSWPGYSMSSTGYGQTPWTCRTYEALAVPEDVDYWVFCDVNP